MILSIPKKLQEAKVRYEDREDVIRQEVAVINSELVTLSKSLHHYLDAQRRIERRIEHIAKRKHKLQVSITKITKCPPVTGPYSNPATRPTPSKESFIKKLRGFSKQRLAELGLRLDALGVGTHSQ